jgi:ATP-binding cassette, subfamily C, bacterial CydC
MNDLRFFITLFKPYQNWLIAGILLSTLTTLGGIALLTLSGWFISSAAIVGISVGNDLAATFNYMQPAAEIRGLAIIRTLGRYGERIITHEATFRVLAQVRIWFFAQIIPLATGRLALLRSGDLLARMTTDIDALDALYLRLIAPVIVAVLGLSGVLIFIYQYAPLISFNTAVLFFIASVIVPLIFNRLGNEGAKAIVTLTANFKTQQIEILQGLRDLVTFQAYDRFKIKALRVSERLIETQRANNRLTALSSALTLFISQLSLLLTVILAATAVQDGQISAAQAAMLVFCVLAAFELITPLAPAMQMLGKIQQAAHNIRQVASLPATIAEPSQALPLPKTYHLKLERLSFRYQEQDEWLIQQLSLNIPQGSKIAIIGNSGMGKTSLLHLLLRFFDPQQGRILLNEEDYRRFNSDELLSCFALLSQRSQLFATTIRGNLLIGKADATDDELNAAITAAGLESLIQKLPDGLETWVGEQGLKVSGGEARRIALARVYLKNAPIILLDEPTEGLDAKTEQDVLAALEILARDKTLIMVTHRSAGLRLVEQVYQLKPTGLMLLPAIPDKLEQILLYSE